MTKSVVWHNSQVSKEQRQNLLGQQPLTIWLTGLSASGKSTLAFALERELVALGRACYVLDGDNVRHGLNKNLGFSANDRTENVRRVAEVARLMNDAGLIVITAFISPYQSDRNMAREIIGKTQFKEVYVCTPIEVCESRDPKGLYKQARIGAVAEFTGVSSPYEPPSQSDLQIDTSKVPLADALSALVNLVTESTKIKSK